MGISGLFKHLGGGERKSVAALSAQHYAQHGRPFRVAIDIAIWLFQIQAGQGGSNPALRTFYYRLLRLISLNIHPLFVFDGPNKPLFKRDKRVGGPNVRVANIPEFLAKQLLKQFGFPMHIAPGEAEAECAVLQRAGVVDAVLSEDVDTIMFGSTITLRNWTAEGSSKTPTHVDVYDSRTIQEQCGLDSQGMILVALMSGGDYDTDGIPGCGPKLAVDASRAGFGTRLCSLKKSDKQGLSQWREELQMEFRTNASKYFTRKNPSLIVPEDFPDFEVLGYYTHPSVSSLDKVEELRKSLRWDLPLDLDALRSFAGDAFEWHNLGGAIKFVRNLAPAILVRDLRLAAERSSGADQDMHESALLQSLHGSREHATTDNAREMRVSFIPATLVPIDLSKEPLDDEAIDLAKPIGEEEEAFEAADLCDEPPQSPSKSKRALRPYVEGQAERIWILRDWVQLGCPAMLEDFEASLRAPKPASRPKAKASSRKIPAKPMPKAAPKTANGGMPSNALMQHIRITKTAAAISLEDERGSRKISQASALGEALGFSKATAMDGTARFTLTSTSQGNGYVTTRSTSPSTARDIPLPQFREPVAIQAPRTPSRKKRGVADLSTPSGKNAITDFFSPTSKRAVREATEVISLLSSSPPRPSDDQPLPQPEYEVRRVHVSTIPRNPKQDALQEMSSNIVSSTSHAATKRRPPRSVLQKSMSMPLTQDYSVRQVVEHDTVECLDLAESPVRPRSTAAALGRASLNVLSHRLEGKVDKLVAVVDLSSRSIAQPQITGCKAVVSKSISTTTCTPTAHTSSSKIKPPRTFITMRESLDGAWTFQNADTVDLSLEDESRHGRSTRKKAKSWRTSAVEFLDLTEA